MTKGWKLESTRHGLARKGIKTGTKNTIFKIYSRGIDRHTGKILAYRTEFVDAAKNELFSPSDNKNTLKLKYEAFWNLNPREEKVVVDKVEEKVSKKSKGGNWGIKLLK